MTLGDLEFVRLLPQFMRDDPAVRGLAKGVDSIVPALSESFKLLQTWNQIDNLSEAELDDLAWELNILWYEADADIDIKRDVIKNSDRVYQHLGTKWAVESVIRSYFGDGYILEWFEYGGLPGHFRIYSTNPVISREKIQSFLHLLGKVKRASAKLDEIYITPESTGAITFGACYEMGGQLDILPLEPRKIETVGSAMYTGITVYNGKLEIYPQGGTKK